MKKIILLMAMACGCAGSLMAADFPWLVFKMADGSEVAVASDGLNMAYSEGVLSLKSASVDKAFKTADIVSMQFAEVATGVADLIDAETGTLTLYSADGVCVGTFDSLDAARVSLEHGIYVATRDGKSCKVIL